MKKDESKTDRLMDLLLQEDAKGGADEEFLSELEEAFEAASESEEETCERVATSPWIWRGAAVASCLGLSAVVIHELKDDNPGLGRMAANERADDSHTLRSDAKIPQPASESLYAPSPGDSPEDLFLPSYLEIHYPIPPISIAGLEATEALSEGKLKVSSRELASHSSCQAGLSACLFAGIPAK